MFKHLLVPTDGTDLSKSTSRAAVRFAQELGAKITAYHARPQLSSGTFSAAVFDGDVVDEKTRAQFEKAADIGSRSSLDFVRDLCDKAGIACETITTTPDRPHEGIIATASQCGADLIFMASHGRKGFQSRMIGSETQHVLTQSSIPVLIFRWGDTEAVEQQA